MKMLFTFLVLSIGLMVGLLLLVPALLAGFVASLTARTLRKPAGPRPASRQEGMIDITAEATETPVKKRKVTK